MEVLQGCGLFERVISRDDVLNGTVFQVTLELYVRGYVKCLCRPCRINKVRDPPVSDAMLCLPMLSI